ncbi:regulator of nonsense transcripts 1-like protein [Anaeramoeba flamelloides]|uniref:Regulator of nonsense transcripts 1-like protein n=1 Tax=Anaeramoeba flamelloides TaxID=1746091 RepID=A0AAV7ZLY0_9EUKA|nr:regulator of nonsense transcripts 1-like protein [Anaeramoeba flamelloides]
MTNYSFLDLDGNNELSFDSDSPEELSSENLEEKEEEVLTKKIDGLNFENEQEQEQKQEQEKQQTKLNNDFSNHFQNPNLFSDDENQQNKLNFYEDESSEENENKSKYSDDDNNEELTKSNGNLENFYSRNEYGFETELKFQNNQEKEKEKQKETETEKQQEKGAYEQNFMNYNNEEYYSKETNINRQTNEGNEGMFLGLTETTHPLNFDSTNSRGYEKSVPNCSFCGCTVPQCLVQCAYTQKWFCNGRGNTSGSHIIHHLVKSRKKEVNLHPQGLLGTIPIECYSCGSKNLFILGFIPDAEKTTVVFLCREPCSRKNNLDPNVFNSHSWKPLIQDRCLLSWIARSPNEEEKKHTRMITKNEIDRLEQVWKKDPKVKIEELGNVKIDQEILHVKINYDSVNEYKDIFLPLVKFEEDHDKDKKESRHKEGINLRWESNGKRKYIATFIFPQKENEFRLVIGDELRIIHDKDEKHKAWETTGHILKLTPDEEVVIQMRKGNVPLYWTNNYRVKFVWRSTPFDRMKYALKSFALKTNCMSSSIRNKFLGKFEKKNNNTSFNAYDDDDDNSDDDDSSDDDSFFESDSDEEIKKQKSLKNKKKQYPKKRINTKMASKNSRNSRSSRNSRNNRNNRNSKQSPKEKTINYRPKQYSPKGLPNLNHSQVNAVKLVLKQDFSLIQGPPGTGKTVVSSAIVYHLCKMRKDKKKILVCAPSNVAVDQLTEKIHATGLKVVRLCAKSRESIGSQVDFLTLHHQVAKSGRLGFSEFDTLKKKMENGIELSQNQIKKYKALKRRIEKIILDKADVICVTCVSAGDKRLKVYKFPQVLIDESTQATEPECLIPLVLGAKKVVFVGDHCQLGPVIMCTEARKAGLTQSLFERLIIMGIKPIVLKVQYRMHPCLSEFPSNTFYEGILQNGVTIEERKETGKTFPWPVNNTPMFFYNSTGKEEISASSTSFLNQNEASIVEKIITYFFRIGINSDKIGIITPYEGQRAYIVSYMQRNGPLNKALYKSIEVASVDSFQGREKDYIVMSCVRSNEHQGIGFLNDPRRLNVSLTRARYGLIMIGNAKVLSKQTIWNNLLSHFKDVDCLVQGPLNNLKPFVGELSVPRRFKNKRFFGPQSGYHQNSNNNRNQNYNNDNNNRNNNNNDFNNRNYNNRNYNNRNNRNRYGYGDNYNYKNNNTQDNDYDYNNSSQSELSQIQQFHTQMNTQQSLRSSQSQSQFFSQDEFGLSQNFKK